MKLKCEKKSPNLDTITWVIVVCGSNSVSMSLKTYIYFLVKNRFLAELDIGFLKSPKSNAEGKKNIVPFLILIGKQCP